MTVLGQFVGFAGRSIGSVIDGVPASGNWKFEFQSKDGSSTFVDVDDATSFYYEYLPLPIASVPAPFTPGGGDLVSFRPCEAKFQQYPPPVISDGVHFSTWLIMGWVTFTMHWNGATYPDTTPYAVLVDPEDAGCYVLCNYQEVVKIS